MDDSTGLQPRDAEVRVRGAVFVPDGSPAAQPDGIRREISGRSIVRGGRTAYDMAGGHLGLQGAQC